MTQPVDGESTRPVAIVAGCRGLVFVEAPSQPGQYLIVRRGTLTVSDAIINALPDLAAAR